MTTKHIKQLAVSAIMGACYVGVVEFAYRQGLAEGSKHPRSVWWVTNDHSQTAFGWDEGNKCMATWSWWTNNGTSGLSWAKLHQSPEFPQ